MRTLISRLAAATVMAIGTLTGCSGTLDDRSGTSAMESLANRPELIELLRATVSYAYVPFPSPAAQLVEADVALVGKVVSVEGTLLAAELEPRGAVIVGLRPVDVWKENRAATGEVVYYWFDRPKNLDESIYQEALPIGTPVVMFGVDSSLSDENLTTKQRIVYTPLPQGLYLPTPDGSIENVWGHEEQPLAWRGLTTVALLKAATLRT